MMSLTGKINEILNSNVKEILQGSISDSAGAVIGWNSKAIDLNGNLLGGGINKDKEVSLKIAVSETIEILEGKIRLSDAELRRCYFDKIPTRCGLAGGYQKEPPCSHGLNIDWKWVNKWCHVFFSCLSKHFDLVVYRFRKNSFSLLTLSS